MRATLTIAPAAARDLNAIRVWHTQAGAGARAAETLRAISAAIPELSDTPFRWPPSLDHAGRRARVVRGHTIIYRVRPDDSETPLDRIRVHVLRIFRPRQSRDAL